MVGNAAGLADLPANGHGLEDFVLEHEIARVVAPRKITILVERLRARRVAEDVVLDVFEREIARRNGGQALGPIIDDALFGHALLIPKATPLFLHPTRLPVSAIS